jgi:hypothetical protein
MQFAIDGMRRVDWTQVRGIHREGFATGLAAFMRNPPGRWTWDARHLPLGLPFLGTCPIARLTSATARARRNSHATDATPRSAGALSRRIETRSRNSPPAANQMPFESRLKREFV